MRPILLVTACFVAGLFTQSPAFLELTSEWNRFSPGIYQQIQYVEGFNHRDSWSYLLHHLPLFASAVALGTLLFAAPRGLIWLCGLAFTMGHVIPMWDMLSRPFTAPPELDPGYFLHLEFVLWQVVVGGFVVLAATIAKHGLAPRTSRWRLSTRSLFVCIGLSAATVCVMQQRGRPLLVNEHNHGVWSFAFPIAILAWVFFVTTHSAPAAETPRETRRDS